MKEFPVDQVQVNFFTFVIVAEIDAVNLTDQCFDSFGSQLAFLRSSRLGWWTNRWDFVVANNLNWRLSATLLQWCKDKIIIDSASFSGFQGHSWKVDLLHFAFFVFKLCFLTTLALSRAYIEYHLALESWLDSSMYL